MSKHYKFKYKKPDELLEAARELKLDLPFSTNIDILLKPSTVAGIEIPNRLVTQPMEGFDGSAQGAPGELTYRRYRRFASGGSGMIWFEATSIDPDGRSNPHQLMLTPDTLDDFTRLVIETRLAATEKFGAAHRPLLVIQLTHSGRYADPNLNHHKVFAPNPFLDPIDSRPEIWKDEELEVIGEKFQKAILLAEKAGFDAVDIKVSHGYLLHEILGGFTRTDSRFGGSFNNRLALIRRLADTPTKLIKAIRLNVTDMIPHPFGFGMNPDGIPEPDLTEPLQMIRELKDRVPLWNLTAGIPYYNPHVNRPFDRPLKGEKLPAEHPLEGVARLIRLTGMIQKEFPGLSIVGSGYSWLRQFYPNIGAGVISNGMASLIGVGRNAIAYPDAPRDLMEKGSLDPKKVCIACSRCTEFMRYGEPSGCATRDLEIYAKEYKKNIKFRG